MWHHDATEVAYRNGYMQGKEDAEKEQNGEATSKWYHNLDTCSTICTKCNAEFPDAYAKIPECWGFCPACGSKKEGVKYE